MNTLSSVKATGARADCELRGSHGVSHAGAAESKGGPQGGALGAA